MELDIGSLISILFKRKLQEIKNTNRISEFSDLLFNVFVEKIVVFRDKTLEFHFTTGQKN